MWTSITSIEKHSKDYKKIARKMELAFKCNFALQAYSTTDMHSDKQADVMATVVLHVLQLWKNPSTTMKFLHNLGVIHT